MNKQIHQQTNTNKTKTALAGQASSPVPVFENQPQPPNPKETTMKNQSTKPKPTLRRGRQTKRERWVNSVNGLSTHDQRVQIAARLIKEKESCNCAECVSGELK